MREIQYEALHPRKKGGSMSELVNQARGLISAASAAIAAPTRKSPSITTVVSARIIVSEAKKKRPNDAAIQSIDLEGNIPDWNEISAAMNVIVKTLS
jgi:hypothetical protein